MEILLLEEGKNVIAIPRPEADTSVTTHLYAQLFRRLLRGQQEIISTPATKLQIKCNKLSGYAFEFLIFLGDIEPDAASLFVCTNCAESESSSFWDELIDEHDGIDDKRRHKEYRPTVPWAAIAHHPIFLKTEYADVKHAIIDACIHLAYVTIKVEQGGLPAPH